MSVDQAIRNEWRSVPADWRRVLVPAAGGPEPDSLDLATRQEVFLGPNYQVCEVWQQHIRRANLDITADLARRIIVTALRSCEGNPPFPQRQFVRTVISALEKMLSDKARRTLESVAVKASYPRSAGLVALAVGLKEAAKPNLITIQSGGIVPSPCASNSDGTLRVDEQTDWLNLK